MDDSFDRPAVPSRIGGLEQLGRYELVCVMSRAEFGSTWACITTTPPNPGKVFSLRRIVIPDNEDQAFKTLMKTASDWQGVTRPGLTPIVDYVEAAGRIGIVSDYVEGEPLRTVLNLLRSRRTSIPQPVAFRIVTDLVQALVNLLGAALKKPDLSRTMHGGLLPDVVLLTMGGETRLSEPGITSAISKIPSLWQHEKLVAYLAPEQLSGGKVDVRTDVFTLGVILWEVLAGKGLFLSDEGDRTTEAVQKRVAEYQPPRLDDPSLGLKPPLDKAIADVVQRALEKKPANRYLTLQEFATALRKAVGTKAGTRKDVTTFLIGLVGTTLDTRRAAIERAVLGDDSPGEVVSAEVDVDISLDDEEKEEEDELLEIMPESEALAPRSPSLPKRARPPIPAKPVDIPRPDDGRKQGQESAQSAATKPVSTPDSSSKIELDVVPDAKEKSDGKAEPDVKAGSDAKSEEKDSSTPSQPADPTPSPVEVNPFEQPFAPPAPTPQPARAIATELFPSSKTDDDSSESEDEKRESGAPPESGKVTTSAATSTPLSMPETSAEPNEFEFASQRQRKFKFIVGGVVGLAALILIVGWAFSSGKDDKKSGSDEESAAAATQEPVLPTEPEPVKEVDTGTPAVDAAPEAEPKTEEPEPQVEAGPEPTAEEPPPPKPVAPVAPRKPYTKPKPKPKPFDPSGI